MAGDNQDQSQKTEEPTQKKLDDARKKGQVGFSREVTSFLLLFGFVLFLVWLLPSIMKDTAVMLKPFIENSYSTKVNSDTIIYISADVLKNAFALFAIPLLGVVIIAFVSSFMQNGIIFSFESVTPKLEKISPLKGLKRMFSLRSLVEFLKGIGKISMIAIVGVMAVYPELVILEQVHTYSLQDMLLLLMELAERVLIGACIIMFMVAGLDYSYQKFEYIKNLRMSKQDIKDEYKQSEGNPEIKAKLRQIRMERAQQRMMAAVPQADVVITNPTHFAIALKYDPQIMDAPMCVAKGQDHIALKIKEVAKDNNVPTIENKPLARALFAAVKIDEPIPLEHYKAVAEIIGYVYKLKGKM
jgi:flagellar biosynthetic protein FlhB